MILSFLRKEKTRFLKGIPVWSFYIEFLNDKFCDLTLWDDINTDFDQLSLMTDDQYMSYIKRKIYGKCVVCSEYIYVKGLNRCRYCKGKLFSLGK